MSGQEPERRPRYFHLIHLRRFTCVRCEKQIGHVDLNCTDVFILYYIPEWMRKKMYPTLLMWHKIPERLKNKQNEDYTQIMCPHF